MDFYWSVLLLISSILLNTAALLLTLGSAGSCATDSTVAPLFSILGSNLLHAILVQILQVHEKATDSFLFGEDVCRFLCFNDSLLTSVPFPTLCLQLLILLRSVSRRKGSPNQRLDLLCSLLCVLLLPWIISTVVSVFPLN